MTLQPEGNLKPPVSPGAELEDTDVSDTTPDSRKNWIAALNRLAALNPTAVVAGHKKPGAPTFPQQFILDV